MNSKLESRIVPQTQFENVDGFMKRQNNYYIYFLNDCFMGEVYRGRSHFLRFQEAYPEMERELTSEISKARRGAGLNNLHLESKMKLWESYKFMSQFVYIDDPNTIREDGPDKWRLCR